MPNELPLIILILVLLLTARLYGELMERLGQLSMIGEIAAGIILGPSLLGLIRPGPELKVLSDLGVFLLVMLAGMEMDLRDVQDAFRGRGALIALMGFLVPFASGFGLGYLFRFGSTMSVFLGLCMALTALPVSVRILMDLGKLETGAGQRIVTAAVQDDVTSLVLLGIILGVKAKGQLLGPVLVMGGKTLGFLATVWLVAALVRYSRGRIPHSRRAVAWLERNLRGKEPLFALTLVFVLGFASLAEAIGLHFVVGAFFGSMVLSRRVLGSENYDQVEKTASSITMGFLAPIFFAAIGVEFELKALTNPLLVASVIALAFAAKLVGGFLGARAAGLSSAESKVIAWGMNGRGVMELVIADLALRHGFIGPDLFSTLVFMGMVTTVLTPMLLKRAFRKAEEAAAGASAEAAATAAELEPAGAGTPAAAKKEVTLGLLLDLAKRRDWARNANGAEADAGVPQWHFHKAG